MGVKQGRRRTLVRKGSLERSKGREVHDCRVLGGLKDEVITRYKWG
jgi:hypothetical protein